MLADFLIRTGIPRDAIFSYLLPGNDINERISHEVKNALKSSKVNIAILSQNYYQSAYCLNEAGVFWYSDVPVIPVALPEITPNNMYGFLNSEYKLRHLDSDDDISYIYRTVRQAVDVKQLEFDILTSASKKLKNQFISFIKARETPTLSAVATSPIDDLEKITDDERVVLYYILQNSVRIVSIGEIIDWLHKNEIYNVNVHNAFDLLSSFDGGTVINDTLEFGLKTFRKYSANAVSILPRLKECIDQHTKLAVNTFKTIWATDTLDSTMGLFVAYIVDERMRSFGDRWMAEGQIESIKQWESKNALDSTLSSNYGSCLEYFVQNDLVFASSWTSYGNVREYSLCPSLQTFLFSCPVEILEELQKVKDTHYCELPF